VAGRNEETLARTIEKSANAGEAERISTVQAQALAHFVLEAVSVAQRFPGQAAAFNTSIDILRDGINI